MADKTVVVLGTATPGGGFPAYGDPYAATLNESDATLQIEPRNTKGSTENVPLLEADKLDLGLATGEVTYEAIAGIGRPATTRLRIINAAYSQAGMFMVRADGEYRTISDLVGKRVVWGAASSGCRMMSPTGSLVRYTKAERFSPGGWSKRASRRSRTRWRRHRRGSSFTPACCAT